MSFLQYRYFCFCFILFFMENVDLKAQDSLVNFGHLDNLTETISFDGDSVDIIHVYSNYPDYHWVDAKESGPEGIACVDDAARGAVLYLNDFELNRTPSSLTKAKLLLKFILNMQADNGNFYNFIFADHSINRTGKTSAPVFGWWTARALWSLADGYKTFKSSDSAFAEELRKEIERALPNAHALLQKYGAIETIDSLQVPEWLMYGSGADATSELLLGLLDYYTATGDTAVKGMITKFCDGLMTMQEGTAIEFPFGAHRSWETQWHLWGNEQTLALASIGAEFHDERMIKSAEREAEGFYARLLIQGLLKEMDIAHPDSEKEFDQIAYGVCPMAMGLIRLFDATKKKEYLVMAGVTSSWFFGNNAAHQQMYFPKSGICYDGITDSITVNKNSGAESTIEALQTLVEIQRYPEAVRYIYVRKISHGEKNGYLYATFADSNRNEITIAINTTNGSLTVSDQEKSEEFRLQLEK
jgi:hypothetical protein